MSTAAFKIANKEGRDPRLEGLHGVARIKERKRLLYLDNRDVVRERNLRWARNNRDWKRSYAKRYGRENSEKLKGYRLKYREKIRAFHRKWYEQNRENKLAQNRAWREANPERYRAIVSLGSRIRNYRVKGAVGEHTADEWECVKLAFDYSCAKCFRREPEIKLTADHKTPISRGGGNAIDNIQPMCRPCNSSKGAKSWFACMPINFNKDVKQTVFTS